MATVPKKNQASQRSCELRPNWSSQPGAPQLCNELHNLFQDANITDERPIKRHRPVDYVDIERAKNMARLTAYHKKLITRMEESRVLTSIQELELGRAQWSMADRQLQEAPSTAWVSWTGRDAEDYRKFFTITHSWLEVAIIVKSEQVHCSARLSAVVMGQIDAATCKGKDSQSYPGDPMTLKR